MAILVIFGCSLWTVGFGGWTTGLWLPWIIHWNNHVEDIGLMSPCWVSAFGGFGQALLDIWSFGHLVICEIPSVVGGNWCQVWQMDMCCLVVEYSIH